MENTDQRMRNRNKAIRLIGIANELLAMARQLELDDDAPEGASPFDVLPDLAAADGHTRRLKAATSANDTGRKDHPIWVELARQTYEDRRRRSKIFQSDDLFGEPAWDILLDLFIAAKERRSVSVTSACIGSAVPSTTALRWITILEKQGLLLREADPGDARRVYVKLSARGYGAMLEYFTAASRSVVLLEEGGTTAALKMQ
ncbi:MarR family transcriptional regulator [Novosphingobium mangrovi (ex Hu et al. 2023)]|uniref:MarR family transcriptional regulator n=1 Tax=Novosphingobium mangrovi (ex Hu et al. 2023) TaxID=2930094 RepID=A0ABT0A9C0_9SPHN|nr:MarR family transcriptional regulator [Novosphingobium mangrovi (ex Hu et al. 2023)]MCJ1959799.1 MarR family transcriptional regulator [Novosphingobium mangrovi (ex Hu et al. 2023)]